MAFSDEVKLDGTHFVDLCLLLLSSHVLLSTQFGPGAKDSYVHALVDHQSSGGRTPNQADCGWACIAGDNTDDTKASVLFVDARNSEVPVIGPSV